jgi:hypothetical protein
MVIEQQVKAATLRFVDILMMNGMAVVDNMSTNNAAVLPLWRGGCQFLGQVLTTGSGAWRMCGCLEWWHQG